MEPKLLPHKLNHYGGNKLGEITAELCMIILDVAKLDQSEAMKLFLVLP